MSWEEKYRVHDYFEVISQDKERSGHDPLTLTLGSDLQLAVHLEPNEEDPSAPGCWVAVLLDGDGNHLSTPGRAKDKADLLAALPLVVDAALRLYPNYLYTPIGV